jgi:hypothetical protein
MCTTSTKIRSISFWVQYFRFRCTRVEQCGYELDDIDDIDTSEGYGHEASSEGEHSVVDEENSCSD